jgi:hypothetical protein
VPPYSIYLRNEAFDFLTRQPRIRREAVLRHLEILGSDPFRVGDYEERDADGRMIQVVLVRGAAILYWADHPVREVKVVAVRGADE